MKLTDLQPSWVRYETRMEERTFTDGKRVAPTHYTIHVGNLDEAQGVQFLCPKCFVQNGNSDIGTHWCDVTFEDRGVRPDQGTHNKAGDPVRWAVSGNGFANLTTQPSIQIVGGCEWHGVITGGEVQ